MEKQHKVQLTCEEACEKFLPSLDGELAPEVEKAFMVHLRACEDCGRHWREYRFTLEALRSLEPLEVPGSVLERIRTRINRPTLWKRLAAWVTPTPQRNWAPAMATISILVTVVAMAWWSPWFRWSPEISSTPVAMSTSAMPILDLIQASAWEGAYDQRILPGAEALMRPHQALAAEQERRLSTRAMLQDDLVLDLSGSEEIFSRIKAILHEVRGRMFIMGIRHRKSGQVVKSRMVIEVPLESYAQVIQQVESLGPTHHLFLDRDNVPLPPDRLRIRVLAVSEPLVTPNHPIQTVSAE